MAQNVLKIGDSIPIIELLDQNNKMVSVQGLLKNGPIVLYFYPKDDTPGCTKEACSFRDQFETFTDKNVLVIGISGDSPEKHKSFAQKHNLPFILLSDKGNKTRKSFGAPTNFLGLIPGRVTYIIDQNGIIRGMFNSQFNAVQHVTEALEIVNSL
jgi:peroxiredoxin Q/BCP